MDSKQEVSDSKQQNKSQSARKPYSKPRLTVYGPVGRLSLGGSGRAREGSHIYSLDRRP